MSRDTIFIKLIITKGIYYNPRGKILSVVFPEGYLVINFVAEGFNSPPFVLQVLTLENNMTIIVVTTIIITSI